MPIVVAGRLVIEDRACRRPLSSPCGQGSLHWIPPTPPRALTDRRGIQRGSRTNALRATAVGRKPQAFAAVPDRARTRRPCRHPGWPNDLEYALCVAVLRAVLGHPDCLAQIRYSCAIGSQPISICHHGLLALAVNGWYENSRDHPIPVVPGKPGTHRSGERRGVRPIPLISSRRVGATSAQPGSARRAGCPCGRNEFSDLGAVLLPVGLYAGGNVHSPGPSI